jgi:hypothetical protein
MARLKPTFFGLNPTEKIPKEPRVIEGNDSQHSPYVGYSSEVGKSSINVQIMPSKVKPGLSVSMMLSREQSTTVPLVVQDMQKVVEIYDTTMNLKTSHNDTITALFSSPFMVTLTKVDITASSSGHGGIKKNKSKFGKKSDEKKKLTSKTGFGEAAEANKHSISREDVEAMLPPKKQKKGKKTEETEEQGKEEEEEEEPNRYAEERTEAKPGEETLDDMVNSIQMDSITKSVIEKYWLPTLATMERYRLQYGICPIYFVQVEEKVTTYAPTPKTKTNKRKKTNNMERETSEPEYEDDSRTDISTFPYSGEFVSNEGARKYWTPGNPNVDAEHASHPASKRATDKAIFAKDLETLSFRSPSEGLYSNVSSVGGKLIEPYDANGGGSKKKRERKAIRRMGEKDTGYATFQDAGEAFGVSLPKRGGRGNGELPYTGKMYSESRGEESVEARVQGLSYDLQGGEPEDPETRAPGIPSSSPGTVLIGNLTVEEVERRKKVDALFSARSLQLRPGDAEAYNKLKVDWELEVARRYGSGPVQSGVCPGVPPPDLSALEDGVGVGGGNVGTDYQRRYGANEEDSEGEGEKTSSSKKRKRSENTEEEEEGYDFKVEAIETVVTHQVPIVPPMETGTVETYQDLTGPRYLWKWRGTKDEFSGKIEPFMMWVEFFAPTPDGKLTSPVSTMIGTYDDYLNAQKEFESAVKASETPLYIIEKAEPKAIAGPGGVLAGDNYAPLVPFGYPDPRSGGGMMQQGGGDNGSFNFNSAEQMAREREMYYGGLPVRPRGYIPGDGVNLPPHWDSGRLVDRTSDLYRGMMPHVAAAYQKNAEMGLGRWGSHPGYAVGSGGYPSSQIVRQGYRQGLEAFAQQSPRRPSYHLYENAAAVMAYETRTKQAVSTGNLTGRPTMYTPMGNIMFLDVGEKVTRMDKPAPVNSATVTAYKEKLDHDGALLGGSPNSMLFHKTSTKGSGSDGVFTSKATGDNKSEYGLSITGESLSPNKEYNQKQHSILKKFYANIVRMLFSIGYKDVFDSEEKWYKKMVKQTFKQDMEKIRRTGSSNNATGRSVFSVPKLQSLFTIDVIFADESSTMDLKKVLDMFKLGFLDSEEVAIYFAAQTPGVVPHDDILQMISSNNRLASKAFPERLRRFEAGLEAALEHDKKKDLKPDAAAGGKKPSSKKKAKTKAKAKVKAKAKAKAKSKSKKKTEKK